MTAPGEQYNAENPPPAPGLHVWCPFGSPTIVPKEGAAPITRPNGSGTGINALIADGDKYDIDFAMSSRFARPGTVEENYRFLQFVRDGLTFATATGSNVPGTLTSMQLNDIYSRNAPDCLHKPYVPPAGSGTRSFFLGSIGLTEAAVGSCVNLAQEHDPGVIGGDPDALAPFSVAKGWDVPGLVLGNIGDMTAEDYPPNGATTPIHVYDRGLYNVLRASDVGVPKYDAIFGPDGWLCTDPDARAIIDDFHFRHTENCCQHVQ